MKELETRILDINIEDIREKIQQLNLSKVKQENQINNIYDFADKRLLNEKGYARIRVVEDLLNGETRNYITTKKLISQEKYKIMEEHETQIEDSKTGEEIFKALGLILIQSIKKYRESYKYKDTLIEIDINDISFCPFPYIEIESCKEEEVEEVVNLLGFTMENTTSKTIYELLQERGVTKGL